MTTSSCAGRIAVYLEGPPKEVPDGVAVLEKLGEEDTQSGTRVASTTGGKGGGKWLFTSHAPVYLEDCSRPGAIFSHLGLSQSAQPSSPASATKPRFVHFKFEPMVSVNPTRFAKSIHITSHPGRVELQYLQKPTY